MIFSPNNKKWKNLANFSIKINKSTAIEHVNDYKYLGLIIDSNLSWKNHINYLKTKLSKILGMLYRIRYFLNLESRLIILHSLFISHLKYGILNWGRCSKTALKPLSILLNRAFRCIYFCGHKENVTKFYIKNNILQLTDIFKLELGKFMFKYNKGTLPSNFTNYFQKSNTYNTRYSKHNYTIPFKNKQAGLNTLSYKGAKLWSNIPDEIKCSKTIQSFSRKYKKLLLEKYSS